MSTSNTFTATSMVNPSGKITAYLKRYPALVVQAKNEDEAREKLTRLLKSYSTDLMNSNINITFES